MQYHYDSRRCQKYPTDAAYSAATGSRSPSIGPRLTRAGQARHPELRRLARLPHAPSESWLPYVSGGMEEQFTKWGNDPAIGYLTGDDWDDQLALLKETQALGKLFLGVSHSERRTPGRRPLRLGDDAARGDGTASFALHERLHR